MIKSIQIAACATYSDAGETLEGLKQINFVYGPNGSGKTTISRVIQAPESYSKCEVRWVDNRKLDARVFNADFVSEQLKSEMRGVFTLGQSNSDLLNEIQSKADALERLQEQLAKLRENRDEKQRRLETDFAEFSAWSWTIKDRFDGVFQGAFKGSRQSKSAFAERLLVQAANTGAELRDYDYLVERAEVVFSADRQKLDQIEPPSGKHLENVETSALLSKPILGRSDVDVADLIDKLKNSDWVAKGLTYAQPAEGKCPFCQQAMSDELLRQIESYFEGAFKQEIEILSELVKAYREVAQEVVGSLVNIEQQNNTYVDLNQLINHRRKLESVLDRNKRLLADKLAEPSRRIELEPTAEIITALQAIFSEVNRRVVDHNIAIDNHSVEQKRLTGEIWHYVVTEHQELIDSYTAKSHNLKTAINAMDKREVELQGRLHSESEELAALEAQVTSVQPTVTAINKTLASFGFSGFLLATAGERNDQYRIVREDGTEAASTLSEGERTFIAFLYFYHLVRGSVSESGANSPRIVVVDDPISSLDSNVLFIVSALIRSLLKEACDGAGCVRQVILLTHNVYFHKEVTYDAKRQADPRSHETFWTVRKLNGESVLKKYDKNPVTTSYELLWSELEEANRSDITLPNTMRRILESYFKVVGNNDRNWVIDEFEGEDQLVCRSLFSWVNEGSHGVPDDLHVSPDPAMNAVYLRVFKEIFVKTGHQAHYDMMWREIADTEGPVPVPRS